MSAPHNRLKPNRTTTLTSGSLWHRNGPHPAASGKRLPSHLAAIGMPETRVKYGLQCEGEVHANVEGPASRMPRTNKGSQESWQFFFPLEDHPRTMTADCWRFLVVGSWQLSTRVLSAFTSKAWLVPGSLLCSVVRRRQCPLYL